MSSTAYLPIVADRYGACVRHVFIVGYNMTGVDMRAQVRWFGDTPGPPLADLRTVTNGNAEGLRLVSVTVEAGLPTSHIEIVINESTMKALPYVGEIGDAIQLAWDWQITIGGRKRRLAKGEFEITGDGVTGADFAPLDRPVGYGRPRQPIINVWSSARLTFGEEQVRVVIDGPDLIAPLVQQATEAVASTAADRVAVQTASAVVQASSRYFSTKKAGEDGSAIGQSFSTKDGLGNVITYERTAAGSVEIARSVTPVTLNGYAKLTGAVSFATDGSRMGLTDAGAPIVPQALFEIRNNGSTTNGFRVSARWTGTTANPYQNNDTVLLETFNDVQSDSANRSWSLSAPNGYNNIPAGVHDSGERVGIYGWAVSVHIPGNYEHRGRLTSQVGVRGRAGFLGTGTPATAVIDQANGIQGEVYADAAGTTIRSGRAGNFISTITPGTGIVENNIGVYAEASGGLVNWAYFGQAGEFYQRDRAYYGESALTAAQSGATISVRGGRANGIEFGNPDPAGYGSNLGSTGGSGMPFLALCAGADAVGNTFGDRGRIGHVILNDLVGGLVFGRTSGASAAGQSLTESMRVTASGQVVAANSIKPGSYTVATVPSAIAHGPGAMIYVSNESGGAVAAFSDGAAWLRCTDRAAIS